MVEDAGVHVAASERYHGESALMIDSRFNSPRYDAGWRVYVKRNEKSNSRIDPPLSARQRKNQGESPDTVALCFPGSRLEKSAIQYRQSGGAMVNHVFCRIVPREIDTRHWVFEQRESGCTHSRVNHAYA